MDRKDTFVHQDFPPTGPEPLLKLNIIREAFSFGQTSSPLQSEFSSGQSNEAENTSPAFRVAKSNTIKTETAQTEHTITDTGSGGGHDDHDMGGGDDMTGGDDGHDDMGGETGSGDGHDMGGGDTGSGDGHDGHDMGGGDTGSGDGHDSNHDDHDNTATITPPGVGASQTEINNYLNALANQAEGHAHGHDSAMAGEHMAALDLVGRGDATHVAIGDGDWDDPSIWSNGQVPGDDARVLIPEGVTVDYSVVSDARLFTVRVDGKLDFATDTDSQMIFDTMVVAPSGFLEIGNVDDPVQPDVNIDLIVADNGRIDTNWDPLLLSRGIVSHGKTTIHGAEKDSHDKVTDDPMAGDTSIKMDGVPTGWQVGDTIVIAGTNYDGWSGNRQNWTPPEDEVRVITAIDDDGTIHFDEALAHDHDAPRADLKTSVANYTRSVSVESESGADSEVYERGHVMFMHNDDVDVRYAEFLHLGRTDKSIESRATSEFDNIDYDTNVQGRYSLHLHRAGVDDIDDPAILEGNAVFGSPGWGYVHHDSNAILENNASYDTHGAGFVAETGNETGEWNDNIAIFAKGNAWNLPKNAVDIHEFYDIANGGDGFWFQGRLVSSSNNVGRQREPWLCLLPPRQHRHDDGLGQRCLRLRRRRGITATMSAPTDFPIRIFENNETFAANEGLHVVKANTAQGHDIWSHLKDFHRLERRNRGASAVHLALHPGKLRCDRQRGQRLVQRRLRDHVRQQHLGNGCPQPHDRQLPCRLRTGHRVYQRCLLARRSRHHIIDATITNVQTDYLNFDGRYVTILSEGDAPMHAPHLDLGRILYTRSDQKP